MARASLVTLTTRQINVLRLLLDRREFSVEDVAGLDYQLLIRTPGIGSKSVAIIRAWLAAQGLDLRNCPADEPGAAGARRLAQRLERASALLRRHGYRVEAPAGEAALRARS